MSARTMCARATALTLALGATGALATALASPASAGGFPVPAPAPLVKTATAGDRTAPDNAAPAPPHYLAPAPQPQPHPQAGRAWPGARARAGEVRPRARGRSSGGGRPRGPHGPEGTDRSSAEDHNPRARGRPGWPIRARQDRGRARGAGRHPRPGCRPGQHSGARGAVVLQSPAQPGLHVGLARGAADRQPVRTAAGRGALPQWVARPPCWPAAPRTPQPRSLPPPVSRVHGRCARSCPGWSWSQQSCSSAALRALRHCA